MYLQFHEYRDAFYEEHGEHVVTPEGMVLFRDGAVDQNSFRGMGPLNEPPEDNLERMRLIKSYWAHRVNIAKTEFQAYQNWLDECDWGNKDCPIQAGHLVTREGKLNYLKRLQKRVKTAQRYVRHWHAEIVAEEERIANEAKGKKLNIRQRKALMERIGNRSDVDNVDAEENAKDYEFRRAVRSIKV